MNKKNLLLALGFLALVGLALYVVNQSNQKTSGEAAALVFKYEDTAAISKVVISNRLLATHTLTRKDQKGWIIDGKTEAAPALVQQVLLALHDLKVKRPCTRSERELIIKDMATDNLKIEVFAGDEPVHTFFFGKPTDENQGNYALLDGSEDPVVVNLPNWQGYASARFLVDTLAWRNKHLFRSTPQTLQRVSVAYPKNPAENAEVAITPSKGFSLSSKEPVDSTNMIAFLTAFSQIYVEEYIANTTVADSLSKLTPAVIVTVKDLNPANSHELRIYPRPYKDLPDLAKQDHILGYLPAKKQAVSLQPQNVVPLMVPKSALVKK